MDLFQYLEGELRTFDQLELTPVDSAAISQMSMIDAPAVVPALRRTDVARPVSYTHLTLPTTPYV